MKYIHEFQNNTEFENYYFGQNCIEPHVSWTVDVDRLDYNKSGKALLRSMPLTFDVLTDGTITLDKNTTSSTKVDYKLNNGDWNTEVDIPFTINVVSGDSIQFRHNTGSIATWNGNLFRYFGGTATFNAKGNIMSLYPGASSDFESRTSLSSYAFYKLFINCTGLIDASELILPATTLADCCYTNMFSGCTSLTTAPALPATTLASYCYDNMFSGCTSLNSAPVLPATTLEEHCYDHMFQLCTSLTTAPALPATILAISCYKNMFSGCTSLTATPELPATTLEGSCYSSMFYGCKNLVTAPALPATTLANYCYDSMFQNCTGLTTTPALPATILAISCYKNMFNGCTSLTSAPALPVTTLANYCYGGMFQGCTSLTTAPALPATTLVKYCYYNMFYNCSKLNYVRCLATDISASYALSYWLYGVSSTGTFYKAAGVTYSSGSSGIPSGWTVQDIANE